MTGPRDPAASENIQMLPVCLGIGLFGLHFYGDFHDQYIDD